MPVYDEEKQRENTLTPQDDKPSTESQKTDRDEFNDIVGRNFDEDELKAMEERAYDGAIDDKTSKKDKQSHSNADSEEEQSIGDMLGGYFKDEGTSTITARANMLTKNKAARRAIIGATAVGVPSLLFLMSFLPTLLGIFKIENFMQNIDASTFSRLNASFDRRSDKWVQAYIKMRLTEINGETSPGNDTLYFRANKVDTDNPIRDWYRTLRTSNFEKDVFEKNGIRFTNAEITGPNGSKRFVPGKIIIRDVPINATLSDFAISDSLTNPVELESVMNKLGPDADRFVETELFSSNKEARKAIKTAVNDNTKSWQVFKRRHLRKDIQNMTGVSSWKLFENTRDKITAKKVDLQTKIMRMVLPDNKMGLLIGCVFGANKCPSKSDPVSKEAQDPSASTLSRTDADTTADTVDSEGNVKPAVDEDGNPLPDSLTNQQISSEVTDGIEKATVNEVEEEVTGEVEQTLRKKLISEVTGLIGNIYTKIWPTLKKLAKIHEFFSGNTIGSLVVNARRAQYMAGYASMAIALSQMKSGDIQGTETLFAPTSDTSGFTSVKNFAQLNLGTRGGQINQYLGFFENAERSEAWILFSGGRKGNSDTAKAAAADDMGRSQYCNELTEKEQRDAPVQYLCPDDGLNGGLGDSIKKQYDATAGKLLGPIADGVNSVNDSPVGGVLNFVSSVADKIVSETVGKIIEATLEATGASDKIGEVAVAGVTKALDFAGAGPKYTPEAAGQLNYMMLGASATAESSARQGGAAVTNSLTRAYANELAAEWLAENESDRSAFNKFASLSNPKSFLSSALMAVATTGPKSALRDIVNPSTSVNNFASSLSSKVFAADGDPNINASSVADWGGVQTYDYPKECIDLDPLEPGYFQKATNAPASVPRTREVLTNSQVFWDAVYNAIPDSPGSAAEEQAAGAVYNCALLDQRVMGGLGYVAGGFSNDGGYDNSTPASGVTSSAGSGFVTPSGYAWPLAPQTQVNYGCALNLPAGCHHDGTPALDLMDGDGGGTVFALYNGVIDKVAVHNKVPGCYYIQFKADPDPNAGNKSFYYFYGHLTDPLVTANQRVTAGTPLAYTAGTDRFTSQCYGGGPHLHIDRGCLINGEPQRAGRDECRDPDFIPFMKTLWDTLPK